MSFFYFCSVSLHSPVQHEESISALSAIVMDAETQRILYEKNAYLRRSMASTTKIMTCLLACESGKLNNIVQITDEMLQGTEGTLLYLKVGDSITLYDLIQGAMIVSGNDAANAIALYIAGSMNAFVQLMNQKAQSLGMTETHFETPSGLDSAQHYSNAYDMAILSANAMKNPMLASIVQKENTEITVNGITKTVSNHNKLLQQDSNFIGLKTGFTKKSGRCLVSAYRYQGNTVIIVTLNAPDDWNDHIKLVQFARKQYYYYKDSGVVYIDCVGAQKNRIRCRYSYIIYALEKPEVRLYYYPFIYLPVALKSPVGEAEIKCFDKTIGRTVVITDEELSYGK